MKWARRLVDCALFLPVTGIRLFLWTTGVAVRDTTSSRAHSQDMETEITCQTCSKRLSQHCVNCLWLECETCQMLIGPINTIYYGAAKKRIEESQRRQNGV